MANRNSVKIIRQSLYLELAVLPEPAVVLVEPRLPDGCLGLRPHALHPGAIQGKEGIKFCHLATLEFQLSSVMTKTRPSFGGPSLSLSWLLLLLWSSSFVGLLWFGQSRVTHSPLRSYEPRHSRQCLRGYHIWHTQKFWIYYKPPLRNSK